MSAIRTLTVLYDGSCAPCRDAQRWLARQRTYVPMAFIPAGSQRAREVFPSLDHQRTLGDLTVVSDSGAYWHGPKAWIVCLWAMRDWREWGLAISRRGRIEKAAAIFEWISRNRGNLAPAFRMLR